MSKSVFFFNLLLFFFFGSKRVDESLRADWQARDWHHFQSLNKHPLPVQHAPTSIPDSLSFSPILVNSHLLTLPSLFSLDTQRVVFKPSHNGVLKNVQWNGNARGEVHKSKTHGWICQNQTPEPKSLSHAHLPPLCTCPVPFPTPTFIIPAVTSL